MEFRENQAIYSADSRICVRADFIEKWNLGEKILSIRDLAILMQVTPNTVQRAYDFLQQREIITNKRGIGYFTEADALERILAFRREQFIANELPVFFRNMYLLNMDFKEVKSLFEQFIKDNFKNKLV
ncbi:MAG: GntR family transcriptional regulator [Segetibacter sp.]